MTSTTKTILTTALTLGVILLAATAGAQEAGATAAKGCPNAEALGWKVGCQAYTFNRFTFFEAVDKVKSLGLHYIEAYPGQKFSPEKPDAKFHHDMSEELQQEALAYLKAADVQLMNYGVVGLPNNEEECRKVFDFAKKMGIETICSEPPEDAFDLLDKLVEEYQINVAIHNHPKESRYWNPDQVLAVCEGRSKRIGACADTGHWMRSDVNPLEAVKKLEGRIISWHLKDLNKYGRGGEHDVPWGTGEADIKAIMAEVKRQGFQGVFSAEYEHNWENSVPDLAICVANLDAIAAELSK